MTDLARAEWLETDGLGGFAMGTAAGPRTRRYHGLLVTATAPPVGRMVLVAGMDVTLHVGGASWSLSTQRYRPGVTAGDGARFLEHFSIEPWPTWRFCLPDGTRLVHELFLQAGAPRAFLSWRVLESPAARETIRLRVRVFLACRDFHALLRETPAFSFAAATSDAERGEVCFRPFADAPAVAVSSTGAYRHEPYWYRRFQYDEDRARGLDFEEDLGAPGEWSFALGAGEAALILSAVTAPAAPPRQALEAARQNERARRADLGRPLDRAAEQYLVERGSGHSIIAGYPWFGDWGRDTFVALRGLCLARGRTQQALDVLSTWAGLRSQGMLPNYFPDGGGHAAPPAYNAVDASLWFVIDVAEALGVAGATGDGGTRRRLIDAAESILDGYARGTRFGIAAADDGLLVAGVPGQQLTWMDARVDGREMTPRLGKPVEVQALWLNALALAARWRTPSSARWDAAYARGRASFTTRFWDPARGRLFDVVDADHRRGVDDASFRPNQIFAVGGLPLALLSGARARAVVDAVEATLLTPLGLRALAPGEPGYAAHYRGGVRERDGAYHQGTVWPWLLGPFVEAWVRVRGATAQARAEARSRFLVPLQAHLGEIGLGHVSEVADAEPPFTAGGCPFQAWSLAELLRLDRAVL